MFGADPPTGHGVLRFPQAVASSPGGEYVFVGDQYGAVVQQFRRDGEWIRDIGWRADRAEPGRIGVVGGLATDRDGNLYVLDSSNDRVQVFRWATGEWIGAWGGPGAFDLGANTGAGGLAIVDRGGGRPPVAYVADQYRHRIVRLTLDRTAAGRRVLPAGARDPLHATIVPSPAPDLTWGGLDHPQGVAVHPAPAGPDGDEVYVADDRHHRVAVFSGTGVLLRQVGSFGTGPGQFRFPYDVGLDARNPQQLYVADNNNHRVQAFDALSLAFAREWGAYGSAPGLLEYPRALAALADDPQGGVFVADTANNRVQGFGADGTLQVAFGASGRAPGWFTRPGGVAVDHLGDVYVADTQASRIQKLAPDGRPIGQWAYVSAASGDTHANAGPGHFDLPHGVAYDAVSGDVWVADTGNQRVQRFSRDGTWRGTDGDFASPRGIAAGPDGAIYVTETGADRVRRRDPATGAWAVVADGLPNPRAVGVEPDGALLVGVDRGVLRVRGGSATWLPLPPGGLAEPTGIAVDGPYAYVTDRDGNRVLRLDRAAGTWIVLATEGNGPDGVVQPGGLGVSPDGAHVYVGDAGNNRVLRFAGEAHQPPAPPAAAAPQPPAAPPPAPAAAPAAVPARPAAPRQIAPARPAGPRLTGVRLDATRVRAGRRTLRARFTVSVPARVRATVAVRRRGRWTAVLAPPSRRLRAGSARMTVTLRRRGRALPRGTYRLTLRATGARGTRAAVVHVRLRVV